MMEKKRKRNNEYGEVQCFYHKTFHKRLYQVSGSEACFADVPSAICYCISKLRKIREENLTDLYRKRLERETTNLLRKIEKDIGGGVKVDIDTFPLFAKKSNLYLKDPYYEHLLLQKYLKPSQCIDTSDYFAGDRKVVVTLLPDNTVRGVEMFEIDIVDIGDDDSRHIRYTTMIKLKKVDPNPKLKKKFLTITVSISKEDPECPVNEMLKALNPALSFRSTAYFSVGSYIYLQRYLPPKVWEALEFVPLIKS